MAQSMNSEDPVASHRNGGLLLIAMLPSFSPFLFEALLRGNPPAADGWCVSVLTTKEGW
jgi:hypothetical protein